MISAGQLRHRATVWRRSTATDAYGRREESYSAGPRVSCLLVDSGAVESEVSLGAAAVRRFVVRMRWETLRSIALTEADRLEVSGRTLRIESIVDASARRRRADIACVEVVT